LKSDEKRLAINSTTLSGDEHEVHRQPILRCGSYTFNFAERTHIMGILNVTPDSFSDGGEFIDHEKALHHAQQMVVEGADIIDVGGESTRPGATPVSLEEELRRVVPLIEKLASKIEVPISIDTTKAEVAKEAIKVGAVMLNDISALRCDPEMAPLAAEYGTPIVLMHMKGMPHTMQRHVTYDSLMSEIYSFLKERITYAESAGIDAAKIIIDPGIGFGKSVPDGNLKIIKHLSLLKGLGMPILVGPSRKAFIGSVLSLGVEEREEGTAAAVALAVRNGAHMVRVHDVKKMKRIVKMVDAIMAVS
jgi:dihydropteroate synthase